MAQTPQPVAVEGVERVLWAARPDAQGSAKLEKRLAVASILAAAGSAERARPRLGRLEVQSRLGGGAMGVVYRAYDLELRRPVALKLLRGWAARDERAQIVDEARRLAQLTHPNVVAVYDIVDDEDGLYFTMEYVGGETLQAWLHARPEASFREVLEWFVQAGRGLCAAHAAGIVHRDFKPDNVLVGADGRVRVVDFGLARVLREGPANDFAGTPRFMAPEILERGQATPASDQFSYCTALRDALSDKDLPAHVQSAIERGLEPVPERRHASLSVLVDLLQGALAGEGDQRPRALLLDRVERMWLRGVLERSLGDGSVIELSLRSTPALVDPPWNEWNVNARPSLRATHKEPQELALTNAQAAQTSQTGLTQTSSHSLSQLFRDSHDSLLLVGPPGAGKTTLLLQLCRDLWRVASLNPDAPAPAVLSLSTYRPTTHSARDAENEASEQSEHFTAWVVDELVTKYGLPRPTVRRWFAESGIVLLLDGLDETEASQHGRVVQTLNHFRRAHPLSIVVTCRDSEYQAIDTRLEFGGAVALSPLEDAAMTKLLEERHAVHLLEQLERDASLRDQLRNPLLLTLYAMGDAEAGELEGRPGWARAYARYVQHVWARTDASERAQLELRLAWLARAMLRHNTSDLWLERLHFGWLPQRWANVAGYAMGVLLVCLFGIGLNVAQVPLTGSPLGSALVFGIGVTLSSFAYTRGRITPIESLRWSTARALRLLPITVVCSLIIGLIEAMKINFAANLAGAGITGAILAVLLALEPSERAIKVRANAGIHQSLENALRVSLGALLFVGPFFYFIVQPYITHPLADVPEYSGNPQLIVGVSVGLFAFTAMFLIYGGFTVLMHYVLRLWLAWRTPLPFDLVSMLDRAAELGLLRRVGGGYMFLHRTLLDYFAEGDAARGVKS